MMNYLGLFIGGIVLFSAQIVVWSIFYDEKINFKSIWVYLSIVCLTTLSIFNHIFVNAFVKMLVITLLITIFNWLIFRRRLNETIISSIYGQFIVTIADVLFALVLISGFNKNLGLIKSDIFDTLVGNVVVALIYVGISYIPFVKKIYLRIVEFTNKFRTKNVILWSLLVIISINFLVAIIYYDMKSLFVVIINSLLIIIYSFIVYKAMNQKSINMIIEAENVSLMESLHQYEDMVDRQRVDNHENKNQLLIIKNMIKKNDKDVIKYIDTVVKVEKEDDEALYTKVKSIPSGGLQGIIYQKMLSMKDNRILFSLDVSRDVRNIDLEKMNIEDNYKLCKIVGVLLDNAIEESLKIDDRRIMISLYVDEDMLIIDISNRFDGKIDLDKIDEEGYTTKGEGHGYGLSLVKKLVNGNDCFINERKVNKDVFKQIIKFKIK